MKKTINYTAIVILSLVAYMIPPATILAADIWAETPDLKDETAGASAVVGPATFKYSNPAVDMWAETPDLDTKNSAHDVRIDLNSRLVRNFDPEMYAETPNLNQVFEERQDRIFEDSVIAEK